MLRFIGGALQNIFWRSSAVTQAPPLAPLPRAVEALDVWRQTQMVPAQPVRDTPGEPGLLDLVQSLYMRIVREEKMKQVVVLDDPTAATPDSGTDDRVCKTLLTLATAASPVDDEETLSAVHTAMETLVQKILRGQVVCPLPADGLVYKDAFDYFRLMFIELDGFQHCTSGKFLIAVGLVQNNTQLVAGGFAACFGPLGLSRNHFKLTRTLDFLDAAVHAENRKRHSMGALRLPREAPQQVAQLRTPALAEVFRDFARYLYSIKKCDEVGGTMTSDACHDLKHIVDNITHPTRDDIFTAISETNQSIVSTQSAPTESDL